VADKKLIERESKEIVTRQELDELLKEKDSPVAYCGYEISGPVHIGTLIALLKQKDFLDAGCRVKVLLADVHTRLNRKGSTEWINQMIEYWETCFKSMGLEDAEYINGSSFQFNDEYVKDVLELGLNSTLNRALRSMQEVARDVEHARVSQVIYPLMQIADIKALDVDIAYGGIEQRKIHMLAREILPEIGYKKPVCLHTPLLCSLKGPESKMSSSKPDTLIMVHDEPDSIKEKIDSAYCPPEIEGNPIIQICEYILFPHVGSLEIERPEKYGGDVEYDSFPKLKQDYLSSELHPQDLKNTVGRQLSEFLKPIRESLEEKDLTYEKPY